MKSPESLFDPRLEAALLTQLEERRPAAWADAVRRLSDHYLTNPAAHSPWDQTWAREALLSYYHPLNFSRAEAVADRGLAAGFFSGLTTLVDMGCGSGAAALGFCARHDFAALHLLDHSQAVLALADAVFSELGTPVTTRSFDFAKPATFAPPKNPSETLLLLSYALTELSETTEMRAWLGEILGVTSKAQGRPPIEAIAILEPSTSQDARRLQALREPLIELGYSLWAPCTHQAACPLLQNSDSDWCHDRTVPRLPSWWQELEAKLPMKNKTVTFSYLLARRKRPEVSRQRVRVIGDRLEEKTKVRQMICRAPQLAVDGESPGEAGREFISWFPSRLGSDIELKRGDVFTSNPRLWSDPRGEASRREFRLGAAEFEILKQCLQDSSASDS